MKHLMTGLAVCAVLAIAAPVSAQTTTAPAVAGPKASGGARIPTMYPGQASAKVAHHKHWRKRWWRADSTSEMLNRQELGRVMGVAPAPGAAPVAMPPGPPNAGAGQGGPRASGH